MYGDVEMGMYGGESGQWVALFAALTNSLQEISLHIFSIT